ncbi:unnamed protein product [Acanthoscelides obtectus]|uniref:Uncharacterized protein n=1 Tax=Acanthoscelides obtectus TaxID=200917 RepID=A0A9P0KE23_ACAOB|nr:unnamed protein product [Acanthoscelides obtectus]CAK1635508.1 hypothetical protein AOBTE_LOCUS9325 [Acanthoscelides obtectus]
MRVKNLEPGHLAILEQDWIISPVGATRNFESDLD